MLTHKMGHTNPHVPGPRHTPFFPRSHLSFLFLTNTPPLRLAYSMHLTLISILALLAAGILAGLLNAIAGGGTIVTFPTLIFLGMNGIVANATSTLALILGIFGSLWGYRHHMASTLPWLRSFLPPSILGGLLGGILLTKTPVRTFDILVPYLILFATLLFMAQSFLIRRFISGTQEIREPSPHWAAILFQFFISLYGGYFGAGIGILMLATLGMMGLHHIVEMNVLKTFLGGSINLIAALYFISKGLIDWPTALIIAAGAVPGYYLGALFSRYMPAKIVRHAVVLIGLTLTLVIFIQQIWK